MLLRWLPTDERQQPPQIASQHRAVSVDLLKNGGRDRKFDACRIVSAPRQYVVDQIAVDAAISILERMDINEAERKPGSCHNGVELGHGTMVVCH